MSRSASQTIATKRFGPVGFCIYCKRHDLPEGMARFSDEHVLPRALGGAVLLTEASCASCAHLINSGFETAISKQIFGDIRHKHGTRSRHRKPGKGAPTKKTVRSHWGWEFEVPLEEYPVAYQVYDFGTATLITGGPDQRVDGNGWWELNISNEEDFDEVYKKFSRKYPAWNGQFGGYIWPEKVARLVAKVAYGTAICHFGYASFDEEITPVILGKEAIFSRWVGGSREGYVNGAQSALGFAFKLLPLGGSRHRLVMDYRMFPGDRMPMYHVVLGVVDFAKQSHIQAFAGAALNGRWEITREDSGALFAKG